MISLSHGLRPSPRGVLVVVVVAMVVPTGGGDGDGDSDGDSDGDGGGDGDGNSGSSRDSDTKGCMAKAGRSETGQGYAGVPNNTGAGATSVQFTCTWAARRGESGA